MFRGCLGKCEYLLLLHGSAIDCRRIQFLEIRSVARVFRRGDEPVCDVLWDQRCPPPAASVPLLPSAILDYKTVINSGGINENQKK